ncbi:hypothetical protein EN866_39165, partial [Mesorhizobium sp. M2D.F.Ca.ET.223.01.1.1]|uniref:hypothetical protein n=1 Tax=Mesorhizobium sp. M2D.F.Ca.ET.223.01.1.1 TaxID=2563940 RepID=UPI001091D5C5
VQLGRDVLADADHRAAQRARLAHAGIVQAQLYVGYGVSLVGAGSVITLKYLLRRGFDVEVESSTVENRGSINWRREK